MAGDGVGGTGVLRILPAAIAGACAGDETRVALRGLAPAAVVLSGYCARYRPGFTAGGLLLIASERTAAAISAPHLGSCSCSSAPISRASSSPGATRRGTATGPSPPPAPPASAARSAASAPAAVPASRLASYSSLPA